MLTQARISQRLPVAIFFSALFLGPSISLAQDPDGNRPSLAQSSVIEEIIIIGRPEFLEQEFRADRTGSIADASGLMASVPGGANNSNGPLSGQIQYRGMSGPRINVRVDGMLIHGGGPNWMAPPLHHIPTGLMEDLVVEKGIASISTGGGIGGAVTAHWKRPEFTDSDRFQLQGDMELGATSTDEGVSASAVFGLSSNKHRMFVLDGFDKGGDYQTGSDSTTGTTEYQRNIYGLGYGFRQGDHQVDVDWRRLETSDTGTPSLPMDIDWFDTDLWNVHYSRLFNQSALEFRVYGSEIDHGMSNYLLRQAPDFSSLPLPPFQGDDKRRVRALSNELGFSATLEWPLGEGAVLSGVEGKFAQHDARVSDPDMPAFFVDNFSNSENRILTAFGQWSTNLGSQSYLEFGASVHRVQMSTDKVDAMPAQMVDGDPAAWPMGTPPRAVWMLRERFNAADRSQTDTNLDWVIKTRRRVSDSLVVELGLARKERAPMYQERFLWIPLEANAGIGDGNNYVGNLNLESETSHQIELGLDFDLGGLLLTPRFYYRKINNYIQGVAVTDPVVVAVSANANGDPTPLQFDNTQARIWGVDTSAEIPLAPNWLLKGIATLVRGEREDIDDNLYRISPDNLRVTLSYTDNDLSLSVEQILVAGQTRLSRTNTLDPGNPKNSFASTSGYGLTHLYATWGVDSRLNLTAGVENLWDKSYVDHLTGFSRIIDSDVPMGQRLPGHGRNLYVRANFRW